MLVCYITIFFTQFLIVGTCLDLYLYFLDLHFIMSNSSRHHFQIKNLLIFTL